MAVDTAIPSDKDATAESGTIMLLNNGQDFYVPLLGEDERNSYHTMARGYKYMLKTH